MNAVEQRHGFVGLVGLQLPDQMQRDVGLRLAQRGPFGLGLGNAVFTEHALALRDQRQDRCGRMGLGNCHQRDFAEVAPGNPRGGGDARAYPVDR